MDTAEEVRMNLASLQRIDPYIIRIKESASQVALYKYSSTQEWEKTETEGTLFVYERKCEPTYGFLILNRLSTNNWIQPISSEIDSQLQAPFLLYKTKDAVIFGIWFYEKEKCELVSKCIDRLVKDTEKRMNQRNKALNSSSEGKKGTDLSSLLSNAASKGKSRSEDEGKVITSMKTTKESPSGGEKLLRLLASGTGVTNEAAKSPVSQTLKNMPLNFAQVTAGGRKGHQNGTKVGNEMLNKNGTPSTYKNVRSRQESNNFSDDIYTEEDIKIMAGEKSPVPERKDPLVTPSTGSVAQFFAQAQAQQEQEDVSAEDKKPELDMKNRAGIEPSVNMIHPPGAVVTGGPPGIRLPNPVTNAPIQGIVPMVPGVPGMALLPQQPGAPPIMVPIIPSTGAHLMAQQQQIRMAVAHAQAAAAAQTARAQHGHLPAAIHGIIPNVDNSVSDELMNNQHEANSPQLPALQSLLSNPAVMSVESLERAHREESKTPPSNQRNVTGSNEMPPIPSKATSATELESDLKNKLNISKSEHLRQKNMDNHSYAGAAKSPNKRTQKGKVTHEPEDKSEKTANKTPNKKQNAKHETFESEEVQLLSPMVFAQPVNGHLSSSMNNESSVLATNYGEVTPLTKSQLSQALQHLLKTDPSFVGKLHAAYVDSLNHKLN